MKAYFEGKDRQRALSFWSISSWGGSGVASFAGGAIATYLGLRWIFIFSIIFAIMGMFLLKDTPESKQQSTGAFTFDYAGLVIFIITMIALNVFINYGSDLGWTSLLTIGLFVVVIIGLLVFIKVEKSKEIVLIDFAVFKNKPYTGATVSNFFLNAIACTPKGVEKPYFNHHPKFDIDEDSLLVAAKAVGYVVCGYYELD